MNAATRRDRHTETQKHRNTDTDTQTHRHTDTQTHTDRHTHKTHISSTARRNLGARPWRIRREVLQHNAHVLPPLLCQQPCVRGQLVMHILLARLRLCGCVGAAFACRHGWNGGQRLDFCAHVVVEVLCIRQLVRCKSRQNRLCHLGSVLRASTRARTRARTRTRTRTRGRTRGRGRGREER